MHAEKPCETVQNRLSQKRGHLSQKQWHRKALSATPLSAAQSARLAVYKIRIAAASCRPTGTYSSNFATATYSETTNSLGVATTATG